MPVQPRTPPGTLELLPPQQIAFQRMLDTIRRGFERFGFLPVETPVFELTDVLLTKSGGETEKQVYFVQSTGALEAGKPPEMALRFDLTVPLARYVAQHEAQLAFPFRRYQIQRVYRGERAQKGRYREFYQCDIDVIGKDTLSLAFDAELLAVIHGVFGELAAFGLGAATIKINNRRLLHGLLAGVGVAPEQHGAVLHEVDRLGKMERAEVAQRIAAIPTLDAAIATRVLEALALPLDRLDELGIANEDFTRGLAELREVHATALALGVPAAGLAIDLSIARGLDYYTGTVYETFLDGQPGLGSICSGGRYDDLAGLYTKSKLPGVGISIGITRLLSYLLDGPAFAQVASTAAVIMLAVDARYRTQTLALARDLRAAGVPTETYWDGDKLGKQLKYADRAKIPLALLLGEREHAAGVIKIKDLRDGAEPREHDVPFAELVGTVQRLLA